MGRKRIENFVYNDIVLYCKGWYQSSGNICDDLGYLLSKIYGWTPKTEYEVALFMLQILDKTYKELGGVEVCGDGKFYTSHYAFECEVLNRMRVYNVSRDMAIILVVRSILQTLTKAEIKLNKPHYGKKEHFRMGGLFCEYPISMTYKEMNRIAEQKFKEV